MGAGIGVIRFPGTCPGSALDQAAGLGLTIVGRRDPHALADVKRQIVRRVHDGKRPTRGEPKRVLTVFGELEDSIADVSSTDRQDEKSCTSRMALPEAFAPRARRFE